jgi:hypothetical protein
MVDAMYVSVIVVDRIFGPFLLKSYCCDACEAQLTGPCYVYLRVCVRNRMTEYIFSEYNKAITNASARARKYTQQKTIKTSYIRLARSTEVGL